MTNPLEPYTRHLSIRIDSMWQAIHNGAFLSKHGGSYREEVRSVTHVESFFC
jgi:hypothetical protein